MNSYDIKTVADAAAELARKTTQNMTEVSIKAWKDFYAFGDTVAKVQADTLKTVGLGHGFGEFYETMNKFQTDAVKNFNGLFSTTNSK